MVSEAFSLRRRAKNSERAPSSRACNKTLKLTLVEVRLLKAEEEAQEAEQLAGEAIQDENTERLEADEDLLDKLHEQQETLFTPKARPQDPRTRRDCTQITVDAFSAQLEAMTNAYMGWSSAMSEKGLGGEYEQPEHLVTQDKEQVWVVDLFSAYTTDVPIVKGDVFLTSAYIRQGLMPTTPYDPNVLIMVHALEAALSHDTPNWRLKNACPACMYKLEGEKDLPPFLATMDGNNSLKRFWRVNANNLGQTAVLSLGNPKNGTTIVLCPGTTTCRAQSSEEDKGAGCSEGWQNMKEDVTARAWGMYDETRIFPALCRHGFVLVVVDMVRSGELAKYGLSVINHLIRVLGEVGMGHDISCKTTVMVPLSAGERQQIQVACWAIPWAWS
ncbi:hypothetical protein K438DRAFT_1990911 [Mycena galopus ATCC 62051]|nr:hypothetical protein K438DRAFT_1990911 [Mycena galopus ATCC 62051]